VTWPWEEGSVEIGAKIIDENTIVFTLVIRAPGVPDWVLPFSPAEIKQGALANSD